jgi:hypothetical protein
MDIFIAIAVITALFWHSLSERMWLANLGSVLLCIIFIIVLIVAKGNLKVPSYKDYIDLLNAIFVFSITSTLIGYIFKLARYKKVKLKNIVNLLKSLNRASIIIGTIPLVCKVVFILMLERMFSNLGDGPGDGMAGVAIAFHFHFISLYISFFCLIIIYIKYFRKKALMRVHTSILDYFGLCLASALPLYYFIHVITDPALPSINFSSSWIWYKWAYSVIGVAVLLSMVLLRSAWTLYEYNKSLNWNGAKNTPSS